MCSISSFTLNYLAPPSVPKLMEYVWSRNHRNGGVVGGLPDIFSGLCTIPSNYSVESAGMYAGVKELGLPRTMEVADLEGESAAEEIPPETSSTNIYDLLPEIMTEIFLQLPLRDLGAAAMTCKYWNSILNDKRLWRGVEARVNLSDNGSANQALFKSLSRRGIYDVQVLSLDDQKSKGLRDLTTSLPALRSLKLSGCCNINDNTLSSGFSSRIEALTVLNLSLCKNVNDTSLGRIVMSAVHLESLDLGGCIGITNRALLLISWGLKKLTKLNLRSCYHITDTGIGFLAGVVQPNHLQEPRMHDFLLKFGLVDAPEIEDDLDYYDDFPGLLRRRRKLASKKLQIPFLQQPSMIQSSSIMVIRESSGSTNLPVQQCSICKQEIKVNLAGPEVLSWKQRRRSRLVQQQMYSLQRRSPNNSICNNGSLEASSSPAASPSSPPPPSGKRKRKEALLPKITPQTEFGNFRLRQLILQDCQKLSDDCLVRLGSLSNLESINLSFCVHITDSGLRSLGAVPSLREINLRACDNITDFGLANMISELSSRLTSLDVSFCDKVRNSGLNYISQFSKLRKLYLGKCSISDEGINRLASSLSKLETLNIGQCDDVTDASMKVIAEKCHELRYIDLYGCTNITREGLALVTKLPKLKHINFDLWVR